MSLLLLFGGVGSGTISPLATDNEIFIITPDEVAAGTVTRVWAEMSDNTTASTPTSDPQIRVFRLDSSGNRQTEVPLAWMNPLGEAWYYDWTPSAAGTFVVTAACHDGSKHLFKHVNVSVRPRFDPVALALHDTLVTRF